MSSTELPESEYVKPEALRDALDGILASSLRAVCVGLALFYALLSIWHVLQLDDPSTGVVLTSNPVFSLGVLSARTVLSASAGLFSFGLLAAAFWFERNQLPTRLAHPVASAISMAIIANCLLQVVASGEARQTTHLMIAELGFGCLLLSVPWFLALSVLALGGFAFVAGPSFKQQDGLRYSARDVAIFRASQRGVPIVLGSATPSLESWYNAQSGRYKLLKLTQRAVQPATLPVVRCMDITKLPLQDGLSEPLLTAIGDRLQRKEQSLIFINRRGYAPVLMCTACGWLSECKHCAGKLVLHLKDRTLRCHHCGFQQRVPHACPTCGDADLKPVGIGTQRLEETLQSHFPQARILRVDRDSTRNKGAWAAMRKLIHEGEADILIGTQMLAKGHDFPNLTLVGVISPDGALYSADFRASEKLFAQLTQVGGRAGRADKAGEVIVQTAFPNHPLFQALRAHDYEIWAQTLLAERQMAGFPPFVYQVLLSAEGKQLGEVNAFLQQARSAAKDLQMPVEIYGVVPAAMPKRANHHRAQLLVQADRRKALGEFLRVWKPILDALPAQRLRWVADVDPMEF